MYPMPGPPTEPQQPTPVSYRQDFQDQKQILNWIILLAYGIWVTRKIWQDEITRLTILQHTIKGLQAVARFFGEQALHAENSYNEYVKILH